MDRAHPRRLALADPFVVKGNLQIVGRLIAVAKTGGRAPLVRAARHDLMLSAVVAQHPRQSLPNVLDEPHRW
jgi:hypothetical protein